MNLYLRRKLQRAKALAKRVAPSPPPTSPDLDLCSSLTTGQGTTKDLSPRTGRPRPK